MSHAHDVPYVQWAKLKTSGAGTLIWGDAKAVEHVQGMCCFPVGENKHPEQRENTFWPEPSDCEEMLIHESFTPIPGGFITAFEKICCCQAGSRPLPKTRSMASSGTVRASSPMGSAPQTPVSEPQVQLVVRLLDSTLGRPLLLYRLMHI